MDTALLVEVPHGLPFLAPRFVPEYVQHIPNAIPVMTRWWVRVS